MMSGVTSKERAVKIGVKVGQTRGGPSKYTADHIEFSEEIEISPHENIEQARINLSLKLEKECEAWHRENQASYKKALTPKVNARPDMFATPRFKDVIDEIGHTGNNSNQGSDQGKVELKF